MSGILDGPLRNVASRLITKLGMPVTLRRVVPGVFQTATGGVANTHIDQVVSAQVTEYAAHEILGNIQAGDRKLLIAAAKVTDGPIDTNWLVLIGGALYTVVQVDPTIANELVVLYTVAVRGKSTTA